MGGRIVMLDEDDESGKEIRSPNHLLKLGNLTKYERELPGQGAADLHKYIVNRECCVGN